MRRIAHRTKATVSLVPHPQADLSRRMHSRQLAQLSFGYVSAAPDQYTDAADPLTHFVEKDAITGFLRLRTDKHAVLSAMTRLRR